MHPLVTLPEVLFEVADRLNLKAPTEAGLAELPPSELEVLRLVTLFPGCGVAFLTDRTRMRQANVSAALRSLGERGLITKEADERDRRAVRLHATSRASRDLETLREIWLKRLIRAFEAAGISEDERERLLANLTGLLAEL